MVKKNEFSNRSIARERDRGAERAVAPAYVRLIFLVGVLGIEDQNIGTLEKFHELGSILASSFLRLLQAQQMSLCRVQFKGVVWFVIRHKSDRAFAGKKAITNANAWMIHESCTDMHFADLEIHRLKLFDFDLSR